MSFILKTNEFMKDCEKKKEKKSTNFEVSLVGFWRVMGWEKESRTSVRSLNREIMNRSGHRTRKRRGNSRRWLAICLKNVYICGTYCTNENHLTIVYRTRRTTKIWRCRFSFGYFRVETTSEIHNRIIRILSVNNFLHFSI